MAHEIEPKTEPNSEPKIDHYQFKSHIGPDGILRFLMQTGLPATTVEIEVTIKPIKSYPPNATPEELGWPPGFFEQTAGSLADDPIERPPQGQFEEREQLL
jgi:hypothetical protein